MAKICPFYGQNMALLWPKYGPHMVLKICFLNHNQCAKGGSMQNFTIHGVSNSPLFLEMAKRWPLYGQNRVLTWSFQLFFPKLKSMCLGMLHAKFRNSGCIP